MKFASQLSRILPRSLLLWCGDLIGLTWFYVVPIRRREVIHNLVQALQIDGAEARKLARLNFCHYGRVLVEVFDSMSWTRSDYLKNIQYHGVEHIDDLKKNGRAAYVLSLHIGNWELAIGGTASLGIPFCIVVKQGISKTYQVIQEWYRGRQDVIVLPESFTANAILQCISSGRTVGFVLDQFMGPPIGLPVKFFGKTAGTAASLALLTERRSADVILTYTYRDERGSIHQVFEKLPDLNFGDSKLATRLYEKTQFFNDQLERVVRKYPTQWMWLHRRWKPFEGMSRWTRGLEPVTALALLLIIAACSTGPIFPPTGIAVPDDKPIEIPLFSKQEPQTAPLAETPTARLPELNTSLTKPLKKETKKNVQVGGGQKFPSIDPRAPSSSQRVLKSIPAEQIPFDIGERLEIALTWMALPAGSAVIEVRKGVMFGGRETFLLWGSILSSRLVDTIYHIDNTIESYIDTEGLVPYKFNLHMFETHQRKETRVLFDHPQSRALFWSKRISKKWGDEEVDRSDALVSESRDMFSALYYSRLLDYRLNEAQSISVFENGQNWDIEVLPVINEMISSRVGVFQCIKLMIKVKLKNVLTQTGDIALWLSDDSKRYLVKFDAKVKIGSLIGNLVNIREKL